jgi:hypothetical protein
MSTEHQIKALRFFNEKATRLEGSGFTKVLFKQKTGISFSWQAEDSTLNFQRVGPNQDLVDAFVLTFRFFIQNNEKSSFQKMAELYENLNVDEELKQGFRSARKHINDFLDSRSMVTFNDTNYSNRHILETFVYGGLSHANESKKDEYDGWMSVPMLNSLFQNEFVYILVTVLKAIFFIRTLNNEALKTLLPIS